MNENQTLGRVASGSRSQSFHDATTGLPENAIRPLPADVIAQLRSSTTITTLNGVVLDLLRNSLDAAATKIDISVDIRRGSCTVEDNGVGIPPSEFREDGSLGKLHCTSKYGSNAVTYGHRGTFLASLASLSLLTITSRHRAHRSHNTLVLHHSRTISRLCPAPVQHEIVSQHHGTRVTVRDLFGNMPVRVKQRTLALDAGLEYERLWDDLKKRLASIMLAWQQPITLKVVDRGSGRRLAIQGRRSLDLDNKSSYSNTGSNLGADMRCGLSLLTQLSYMTTDEGSSWVPASAKTSSVSIRGMISMDPAPSRTVQFISLGVIPLSSESGHNELFDEVNRLFHLSSFGIENDDDEVDEVEKGRGRDGLHRPDECTGKQQKGTRKRVDRWPMFCFWIALHDRPCSLESIQELPERTLKSILDVTRAMVTQWLLANHFRPRGGSQRSKGNSISVDVSSEQQALVRTPTSHASPAHTSYGNSRKIARITASRKVNRGNRVASHQDSMAFDNWSKIKSGNSTFYEHLRSSSKPSQVPNEGYSFRILDQDTINEKIPFQSESIPSGALGNSTADRQNGFSGGSTGAGTGTGDCSAQPSEDANDNMFAWTNPTDGVTYRINARTGLATKDLPWQSRPISSKNPSIRSQTNRSCLSDPTSQNNASTNWIADVLREWKNPAFAPSEECIPQAALTGSTTVESNLRDTNGKMDFASAFTNASSLLISSKISKSDLASSKVISQVDSKFILVIVASAPEKNLLVLIDQHAADERCRVEALLADICSPTPVTHDSFRSDLGHVARVKHVILSQPLDLSISTKEAELFETHAGHFAAWGILYNTEPSLAKKSNSTIMVPTSSSLKVVALPPSISERCKLDPPVLLSFLQSEVWHLRSGQQRPCPGNFTSNEMPNLPDRGADAHPWLRGLGSIPKGLLDMLNSRACRSAIMFNDCLDKGQCESLVHDLATCAFPFVCAHGRPSLVPLVELGQGTGGLDLGGRKNKVNETKQSFARAWQGWKGENDDPI